MIRSKFNFSKRTMTMASRVEKVEGLERKNVLGEDCLLKLQYCNCKAGVGKPQMAKKHVRDMHFWPLIT